MVATNDFELGRGQRATAQPTHETHRSSLSGGPGGRGLPASSRLGRARALAALGVLLAAGLAPAACGGSQKRDADAAKPDKIATANQLLAEAAEAEKAGKPKVAAKKYQRAYNIRPAHYATVERYVVFLYSHGKADKAVEIATELLNRALDDIKRYHLLADAKMEAGDLLGAYDTLSQLLELASSDALAYEKRGRVQAMRKNYEAAVEDLRKAIELAPDNPDFLVSLGSALQQNDQLGEAQIEFRKALQLDEGHARAHLLLGVLLREQREYGEALEHHERAAELQPDNARAHFELGVTRNYNGLNEQAELSLATAVKLAPGDAVNWYAHGEILRNLKRYQDAVPQYRQALELDPDHPKAANKLGLVLFYAGEYEEAEVVLTAQIKRKPDDPYPYFNLGQVYAKTDKLRLAIEALEKFVELAPAEDGDVPVARSQIRQLRRKVRPRR